ncbi:hypothetical protein [Rhizobium sp. SSA_523]|uniref:hypothetical protein n=1 Tax=Rhizobium sp. SSA_523 TaxID=2952477 RepID=UPI00209012EF|nr:hypothetical protein [Rhizobium sp. SSA_523]MCO5730023.1 hypothetical protein [Rhizobium sp. SSA_523]WKC25093.1 hypothetical protein QTJ18_13965 [Rhizobium sp. SSA_523]
MADYCDGPPEALEIGTEAAGPLEVSSGAAQAAARSCHGCTLCCVLPEIDEFEKPADIACTHCAIGQGCTAYDQRPQVCRNFLCLWVTDDRVAQAWQPLSSHMVVYRQGRQLTVLVDPDFPTIWQEEPFATDLARWAVEAEAEGGYLILFSGDTLHRIRAGGESTAEKAAASLY